MSLFVNRLGMATLVTALGCMSLGCGDDDTQTGPGAALKCASSMKNAWETYGVDAFVAVNKEIFRLTNSEVTANGATNVGDSFGKVTDAATFEGKLAAFLVFAYGGPLSITYTDGKKYDGPQDMKMIHKGMNITDAQYTYFLTKIVVPALKNKGVPDGDVGSCFAPPLLDAAFKASIINQ